MSDRQLHNDLLKGASEISLFLFGTTEKRRSVYNLVETSTLPHFKLGGQVCARKSRLLAWIIDQERRALEAKPATTKGA